MGGNSKTADKTIHIELKNNDSKVGSLYYEFSLDYEFSSVYLMNNFWYQ